MKKEKHIWVVECRIPNKTDWGKYTSTFTRTKARERAKELRNDKLFKYRVRKYVRSPL